MYSLETFPNLSLMCVRIAVLNDDGMSIIVSRRVDTGVPRMRICPRKNKNWFSAF